jgi:GDP-mannose transporter
MIREKQDKPALALVPWVVNQVTCGRVQLSRSSGEVAFAILAYSLCSSSMLIINKLAVTSFPMASFVTSFQLYFCSLVVLLFNQYGCIELEDFEWSKVKPYLIYVSSFVLGLFTNMMALGHGNVETVIIFRACVPLAVAFLDWGFLGRHFPSTRSLGALVVLLIGAYGYISFDKEFKTSGWVAYTWVVLYFFVSCFSMTFGKYVMNQVPLKNMWSSVLYTNVLGLPMTLALGIYMGEVNALRSFIFNDVAILNIVASSIVGVGISWAGFKSRSLLSATSYTVVGIMNKMMTIAVNSLMWDKHATTGGTVCLLICIAGGLMYKQAPKREAKQPTSPHANTSNTSQRSVNLSSVVETETVPVSRQNTHGSNQTNVV